MAQLGMSECAHRFAENRIDFSVLCDLTDQDLPVNATDVLICSTAPA
jgi:hypothetical protein